MTEHEQVSKEKSDAQIQFAALDLLAAVECYYAWHSKPVDKCDLVLARHGWNYREMPEKFVRRIAKKAIQKAKDRS